MKIDHIPEARELLDGWFSDTPKILNEWTDGDTFYLSVLCRGVLYSIRIFNLFCDTWELSQDNQARIYWPTETVIRDGQLYVRRVI